MGINHRGTYILVTKQFLDGADIISIFEQMRRKTVSEGMTIHRFVDSCQSGSFFHRFLQATLMEVMATYFTASGVFGKRF